MGRAIYEIGDKVYLTLIGLIQPVLVGKIRAATETQLCIYLVWLQIIYIFNAFFMNSICGWRQRGPSKQDRYGSNAGPALIQHRIHVGSMSGVHRTYLQISCLCVMVIVESDGIYTVKYAHQIHTLSCHS